MDISAAGHTPPPTGPGDVRLAGHGDVRLGTLLRALRRAADLSQRDLALRSEVPQATISRIESGMATNPSFRTIERLVKAAGARIMVDGATAGTASVPSTAAPPIPHEDWRDSADRHYPAHLDVAELTRPERWWGAWWASTVVRDRWPLDQVPPVTYDRNRHVRDERRARVAQGSRAVVRGGRCDVGEGRPSWEFFAEVVNNQSIGGGADRRVRVVGRLRACGFEDGGDGVRWPAATPVPDGTVVLDGVAVRPDWRLLGIGRRLVEALRREVTGIVIVLAAGSAARGFLEACGFQITHAFPTPMWFVSDR
jgi:transcriptional regulator with XRE-family HTH domain/ribosomal protein S18 acetylase RimI-like enzyme